MHWALNPPVYTFIVYHMKFVLNKLLKRKANPFCHMKQKYKSIINKKKFLLLFVPIRISIFVSCSTVPRTLHRYLAAILDLIHRIYPKGNLYQAMKFLPSNINHTLAPQLSLIGQKRRSWPFNAMPRRLIMLYIIIQPTFSLHFNCYINLLDVLE